MARKYNKEQREAMTLSIWELRRTGLSMCAIAVRLGCSSQTVHSLLNAKAAEVAAESRAIVEEMKAEQTERLDYVIEEALESWRGSKSPSFTEKIVEKRIGTQSAPPGEPTGEALTLDRSESLSPVIERTETRTLSLKTGEPAYLAAAMAAMEAQRRIWGLDAPRDDKLTLSGAVTVVEYPEGI